MPPRQPVGAARPRTPRSRLVHAAPTPDPEPVNDVAPRRAPVEPEPVPAVPQRCLRCWRVMDPAAPFDTPAECVGCGALGLLWPVGRAILCPCGAPARSAEAWEVLPCRCGAWGPLHGAACPIGHDDASERAALVLAFGRAKVLCGSSAEGTRALREDAARALSCYAGGADVPGARSEAVAVLDAIHAELLARHPECAGPSARWDAVLAQWRSAADQCAVRPILAALARDAAEASEPIPRTVAGIVLGVPDGSVMWTLALDPAEDCDEERERSTRGRPRRPISARAWVRGLLARARYGIALRTATPADPRVIRRDFFGRGRGTIPPPTAQASASALDTSARRGRGRTAEHRTPTEGMAGEGGGRPRKPARETRR